MKIRNNTSNTNFKGAVKISIPKYSKNYAITRDLLVEIKNYWSPGQIGHIRNGDELNLNFHNLEVENFSINYLKQRGISNLSHRVKSSLTSKEFRIFAKSKNFSHANSGTKIHGAIKFPVGYDFKVFVNTLQRVDPHSAKQHLQQAVKSKDGSEISIPFFSPETRAFTLQYLIKNRVTNYTVLDGHILEEDEFRRIAG